jgi:CRP/FNR family cyclic AMP-dependent transcriptional regulator
MARHAYHEHLTGIPLFAGLNEDELDQVAMAATQLDYQPGKVLMREGELAHEMFVVVDGTLEVTRDGEHIADIGPGGFAGEMALLAHSHRNSSVVAKTPCSVLHLDGRQFASIIEDTPSIAAKLLPVIAKRMGENLEHHSD